MEQFLDYKMVEDYSVVEQAHEIHMLAKDLRNCSKESPCMLPVKFVVGGIISKLPLSYRDFTTSLKHKRYEFTIDGLIGTLDVEEKARAKGTREKGIAGTSNTNLVPKKNFKASDKKKNKPQQNPTKTTQTNTFKEKNKKGACYVCESPDHFAAKCPNRKGGKKSANMVISEPGGISRYSNLLPTALSLCERHLGP
jgi:hypothetical protein